MAKIVWIPCMKIWRETTSEPGEEAPRTCGVGQSGAAQERSLDNSVIKCFWNCLYLCVQCVKCELHAQQGVRATGGVSLLF